MYTWLATEILTGRIIADLRDLDIDSVKRTLMRYESAQGTLPLPTAPENWQRVLLPKASCLHLVDGDVPVWGGMVLDQEQTSADALPVSVATIEAYFADRYVGDVTYSGTGQNLIVKDLVERYAARGSNGGIPIRVVVLDGPGPARDRTYTDRSGKTLYSALRELSGVVGGPEWTVEWEWQHDPERITPVLYVGSRVGVAPAAGLLPPVFEMPGPVRTVTTTHSYKAGSGANDVMAYSTANGDEQPQSRHVTTRDPERPTIEYRWSPSSSITEIATLNSHATARAAELAGGSRVLSLTAVAENAPRLGINWSIGDDIGYVIGGTAINERGQKYETVPGFPGGLQGIARAIGWELNLTGIETVTPVLQNGEELGDTA